MSVLPTNQLELARFIDHTLLKPEAIQPQLDQLCDEALKFRFYAVCVNPYWVRHCVGRLDGSECEVASVSGFPLGANRSESKATEARIAVDEGASEIDMVVNLGALRAGEEATVTEDIAAVVNATRNANPQAHVKVILETGALTDEQIILGCRCARNGGAAFVKTSTGFHSTGGATVEHVRLLRKHAGEMSVKASGGIRDLQTALAMIEAGADRLGMSAGVTVVEAFQS